MITVRPPATITAASPSYADVSAAVSSASSGDTVIVPAGTATWSSQLVITKGIKLIGAGIGKTVITSGYNAGSPNRTDSSSYLFFYSPTSPAANEPFRFSGFSFDGNDRCGFMCLENETTTPINKIRIDHNSITNTWKQAFLIYGTVYGVADNNVLSGTDNLYVFVSPYGLNEDSWNNLTFDFGTADNFYFEDNEFTSSINFFDGGLGGRVCVRYNTFHYTGTVALCPLVDAHGNQPGANLAAMGVEVYSNTIDFGRQPGTILGHRGGKGLVYNNSITTTASWVNITVNEEYLDSLNPPATNPGGQPQHISDSYYWNNLKNGTTPVDVDIGLTVNYGGNIGIVPRENREFWQQGTTFNGTTGVGAGLLSARPTTCTKGVAYWATDTKTLYRAQATNTWEVYYRPYTYPHPLRER
jgi:hypothetical protein